MAPETPELSAYERWHRHGVEYLMRERPLWAYIPGIAAIWLHGHRHGMMQEDQWHQKHPLLQPRGQ